MRHDKFRDYISTALSKVIKPEDNIILIYSGIWRFAHQLTRKFDIKLKNLPDELLMAIEDFVGPRRTLIFPTYYFKFPETKHYDKVLTESDAGILSQTTVKRKEYTRTNQPMNSYAIKGDKAEEIASLPATTAWGPDTPKAWFYKHNIRICALGVPWHLSCSFIHSAEENLRVPYRYFKRFNGIITENNKNQRNCFETMYVRAWDAPVDLDYQPITREMELRNLLMKTADGSLPIQSINAKAILDITSELLRKNPYVFVKNVDVVKQWVESGKQKEIDNLKPEERHEETHKIY